MHNNFHYNEMLPKGNIDYMCSPIILIDSI